METLQNAIVAGNTNFALTISGGKVHAVGTGNVIYAIGASVKITVNGRFNWL